MFPIPDQLTAQVLRAASTGLQILLIGDTNPDHTNPNHRRAVEANEFLQFIETANMRHLPTATTWRSDGLFKTCLCSVKVCECPKQARTSTIDNAFCSIGTNAKIRLLTDTIADHSPLLVILKVNLVKTRLETMWTRDLSKVSSSDFEAILECSDWSQIYAMSDPDVAPTFLINNVKDALDKVAPPKLIKFRPDKPPLSLKKDTLNIMALRDNARLSNDQQQFRVLRNWANKLIKRDKLVSVHERIKKNPGLKQIWREAKNALGKGSGANNLPNVTTNHDPKDTAGTKNKFVCFKIFLIIRN